MARYRVGRKLGRTIYDGDRLIGMMDDVADAYWIVELMNRAESAGEAQPPRVGGVRG